jgi:hypothetical protein
MKLYTVSKSDLIKIADQIESDAKSALRAWIILGQSEKYSAAIKQARALRTAAENRSIWVRREIVRAAGFSI